MAVEREILGFDHAELGGMLLRKWRFPESLEQAVWRHHAPATADAPLAWLSLEHPAGAPLPQVRLRSWPGGTDELLALAHPHGTWVDWAVAA